MPLVAALGQSPARPAQFAFAATEPSSRLHLVEFLPPQLGERDVFVDITHGGMCHSDLHKCLNEWSDAVRYPMVPGHEVIGVVSKVGASGELRGRLRAAPRAVAAVCLVLPPWRDIGPERGRSWIERADARLASR